MQIDEVINSVKNKHKEIPAIFYKDCEDYLQNLKKTNPIVHRMSNNKYLLESIRLYLNENLDNYLIYCSNAHSDLLSDSSDSSDMDSSETEIDSEQIGMNDDQTYRIINGSKKMTNNILRQLIAIENGDIMSLCSEQKFPVEIQTICCTITKEPINNSKYIEMKNKRDCLKLLLGVESITIAEHQDFERFCNFTKSKESDIMKSVKNFNNSFDILNKLDDEKRDRVLIFSGFVLHSLGTTYTADTDLLYYGDNQPKATIDKVVNLFNHHNDFDHSIIYEGKVIKREPALPYLYNWLYTKWPNTVGKDTIMEIMADPEYHFYFMGIRFVGIKMSIERLLNRASPSAFVDLIMLKKINNYDSSPCFPNLTLRQGKITIYTDDEIEKKLNTVKNYFKWWHKIDITIPELKEKIKRCSELPHYIYSDVPLRNKHTFTVTKYHDDVAKYYVEKYLKSDKLLDVGAGKLRDIHNYDRIGFKKLVAIEPSSESIKMGLEKYKKHDIKLDLEMINGFGDEDWLTNPKYKQVIDNAPFSSIVFKFTIHYMIRNIDIVLKNIQGVDNENTTLVIFCLDKDRITERFKNKRYEIYMDNEPLYGIYELEKSESLTKAMIYFKGVYGVEKGSIEYLVDVDNLIELFGTIGYNCILNEFFSDMTEPHLVKELNHMSKEQKKISEIHKVLIFKKISNVPLRGGMGNHEQGIEYRHQMNLFRYMYLMKNF